MFFYVNLNKFIILKKNKPEKEKAIKPFAKGTTTAHFVKVIRGLADIMSFDKRRKSNYLVMGNTPIYIIFFMKQYIEGRGYSLMYLLSYSPESNPTENI